MKFKVFETSFGITTKKFFFLLIITSSFFSIHASSKNSELNRSNLSNKNNKENQRNLQFTTKSVFYTIPFPKNNITGTGDIMNDVPYKALCNILNCNSGCCVGEIDSMSCGDKINCDKYFDYKQYRVIAPAVIVPICVFLFIILLYLVFRKRNKYSILKSLFLAVLSIFIISIPYVFYYARKKADDSYIKKLIKLQKYNYFRINIF